MKKFKSEEIAILQDRVNKTGIEVTSKELLEKILNENRDRIVGYVRTAYKDEYGMVIKNQKEPILKFCEKYNITCKEILIDNGYSMLNYDRPGLKKITGNPEYKVILVKDFSRFSREYIYTKRYIEDNKKMIISVIDSNIWRWD